MITITIDGPRGEGKTVTAIRILRMLRQMGQKANYVGFNHYATQEIEKIAQNDLLEFGNDPKEFLVVDSAPKTPFHPDWIDNPGPPLMSWTAPNLPTLSEVRAGLAKLKEQRASGWSIGPVDDDDDEDADTAIVVEGER